MDCHVCGKTAAGQGAVEGTRVPLCEKCSVYSSNFAYYAQIAPAKQHASLVKGFRSSEAELSEDYGKRIMQAREKLGLSRKELARKILIQEKELEGFEQQKYKPGEATVKKLEFALGIRLFERVD